ncbi:GNAT family N-acetyltransferase [Streptomyces meridianus]|uniref:GNAT family N-acetyltransferase n=1 Tax=Streptomyces meridianus TaxID=2938945 RepID=A0ABT0X4B2_9ACTN|nr:GNAT family protein [Streptomyces meridianus]MCM2577381.1 GNAT family N-acetyltransferase [Streptomyces meridianus]
MEIHATDDGGRLVLAGERVMLREQTPEDARFLALGEPGDLIWVDGVPGEGTVVAAGMTLRAAAAGVHRPGRGLFVVRRTEDSAAVGGIGFHSPPAEGTVEIGYDLTSSARGSGLATEAVRLLSAWALRQPEVERVVATTEAHNVPSQRVLERAGYRRVEDRGALMAFELAR